MKLSRSRENGFLLLDSLLAMFLIFIGCLACLEGLRQARFMIDRTGALQEDLKCRQQQFVESMTRMPVGVFCDESKN